MINFPWSKLHASTIRVEKLDEKIIGRLFYLYQHYYENTSIEVFEKDLKEKTHIILLKNRKGQEQGFSTLTRRDIEVEGRSYHVLYSGDTIISPDYWGTAALTMEFLKNIISAKVKRPFSPVYWFLISKGYKTYLLLANNFINYYPRYDKQTPKREEKMLKSISDSFFPSVYNEETGLLTFDRSSHEKLKSFVAPITDEMKVKYPKIAFFEKKNPDWMIGDELACIGRVDLSLVIVHPFKILMKKGKKLKSIGVEFLASLAK
ncbi:hypothetical protein OAT67_02970 [Bacteriovoracaceae bacterium]|nr:hypothetical protein [Bacteriovoracaceae bacterium]